VKVVEIIFNLTNPNEKPYIESWEVSKETERYYYCKAKGSYSSGRRFFKPSMEKGLYHRLLQYKYATVTDLDVEEFLNTEEAKNIILNLYNYLNGEIKYYTKVLNGIKSYYAKNYCIKEVSNE
jgi:hypothetical protein